MPANLPWTPKVSYGPAPTTLTLTFPARPFEPEEVDDVGSSTLTGNGVPVAFVIREQYIARIALRFFESEWPAVEAWLSYMRRGSMRSCTFWFDQDDDDTDFLVYLHEPMLGKGSLRATRSTEFRGMFELEIALRRTDGSKFDLNWSGV